MFLMLLLRGVSHEMSDDTNVGVHAEVLESSFSNVRRCISHTSNIQRIRDYLRREKNS